MTGRLFTSESVTEGHPDKIADAISDTVLDALLADDPDSRVACETMLTTGLVIVAGEVTTKTYAPIAQLVRNKILEIGYDSSVKGFDGNSCGVQIALGQQTVQDRIADRVADLVRVTLGHRLGSEQPGRHDVTTQSLMYLATQPP